MTPPPEGKQSGLEDSNWSQKANKYNHERQNASLEGTTIFGFRKIRSATDCAFNFECPFLQKFQFFEQHY